MCVFMIHLKMKNYRLIFSWYTGLGPSPTLPVSYDHAPQERLHTFPPQIPDRSDYFRIRPQGLAITTNSSRRECFDVRLRDDELNERRESFFVRLQLDDTRELQSGVLVQPDQAEIFIEDDDGMESGEGRPVWG